MLCHTDSQEYKMKPRMIVMLIIFALSGIQTAAFAGATNPPLSEERQGIIKKNILAGLEHRSMEVRCDYIQLVIDLKRAYPKYNFDYAIIPLMDKLKNEDELSIRILAALALYEYQDSRMSRFAVQQTALHDSSPRLARHCQTLLRKWDDRNDRPLYITEIVYPF
jgi:hypothetical protein